MKKLAFSFAAAVMAAAVFAEPAEKKSWPTPLEINLADPLQLPWGARDVWGLRLNLLYGAGYDIYGLDLGLVGVNVGTTAGLQANAFNWTDGSVRGLQLGGVFNYVSQDAAGVQLGGFLTYNCGDMAGLQLAPLNFNTAFTGLQLGGLNWNSGAVGYGWALACVNTASDFTGFGLAALNYVDTLSGAQFGAFNVSSGTVRGVQVGVFNLAGKLDGVQIGLLNMVEDGEIPVLPVFNAGF